MKYLYFYFELQDVNNLIDVQLKCPEIGLEKKNYKIEAPLTYNQLSEFSTRMERISRAPSNDDEEWLKAQGTKLFKALFPTKHRIYGKRAMEFCNQEKLGLQINIFAKGQLAQLGCDQNQIHLKGSR